MSSASRYFVLNSHFSELSELQEWATFSEMVGHMMYWGYETTLWVFGWAPFDPSSPGGLEALSFWIGEARELANKIVASSLESRKQSFSSWVQEHSEGGLERSTSL